MLSVLAFTVLGAILGSLAIVNVLLWAAGVRFSTGRQIAVAYAAFMFSGVFINAVGNADGGPPNFDEAGVYVLGGFLAAFIQAGFLWRQKMGLPPPLPR